MKYRIVMAVLGTMLALAAAAQPKVVAHRGYWRHAGSAQNSLAAFNKADSIGVYGAEIDVWMTADGRLVVNHDKVFKGVDMENDTYDTIRRVRLDNGEVLPDLDEYLRLVQSKPGTRLVLEMKSLTDLRREDECAAKIVDALRRYGLLERTDIIAFSINACLAFKKLCPVGLPIYYLEGDLDLAKLGRLGLSGLDCHHSIILAHPEWVDIAHKAGLKVNAWTVDNADTMRKLINLGVDFITTNEPELLQAVIKEQ